MALHSKRNNQINEIIAELLLEIINKRKHNIDSKGFKEKYDTKIYVYAFIKRLRRGTTWLELEDEFKISDTHLNRIFNKWTNENIFSKVYSLFLSRYYCYIDYNEVYIDTTIVMNKYGYRHTTGINTYEARKHRSDGVSAVVSENGIPLGIKLSNSSVHDIKILMDTLPKKTYFETLIGNKGYISKNIKQKLKRNRRINLITECRKNQKIQNKVKI